MLNTVFVVEKNMDLAAVSADERDRRVSRGLRRQRAPPRHGKSFARTKHLCRAAESFNHRLLRWIRLQKSLILPAQYDVRTVNQRIKSEPQSGSTENQEKGEFETLSHRNLPEPFGSNYALFLGCRRRPLTSGPNLRLTHERGAVFHHEPGGAQISKKLGRRFEITFLRNRDVPGNIPRDHQRLCINISLDARTGANAEGFAFDCTVLQFAIENQFAFEGNGTGDFNVTAGGASLLVEISHGIEFGI
jgi:hypothetical protein